MFNRLFTFDVNDTNKHFYNDVVVSPLTTITEKEELYTVELAILGYKKELKKENEINELKQ